MKKLVVFGLILIPAILRSQSIQSVELLNVADGKMTGIKNCAGCSGAVVIFTSLKCPYDQHYRDRIKALHESYGNKIAFFLVNAATDADENEVKMKSAYDTWGLNIPYLSDKKQIALQILKPTRTPEAILLQSNGTALNVVYQGAIDDNPQVHHDTGKDYLKEAIEELLASKPISNNATRVTGCIIRKI